MSTNVDTAQVAAAAARVRAVAREADVCAQGILTVRQGLDMRIAASESIDGRLRSLSSSAARQAGELTAHSAFLSFASSRYDTAENVVRGAMPGKQAATGEARVGVPPAFRPPDQGYLGGDGARPAAWNDLIRALAKDILGADEDVQEGWVDLVGAVPILGTLLTIDEIIVNVQNQDPGASASDTFKLVAAEGAERGFGVPGLATLVGLVESYSHFVLSDQFQTGVYNLLPDGAVEFLASDANNSFVNAVAGVGEGISGVAQGAVQAAGGLWDWVNPW